MDSYRASKAWHIGHQLAAEVQAIAGQLPIEHRPNLPGDMHRSSVTVPHMITLSVGKKLHQEKLQCYVAAREAAIELQEHLSIARDVRYIEQQVFNELAGKAIEVQQILTGLIRKLTYEIAAAEE